MGTQRISSTTTSSLVFILIVLIGIAKSQDSVIKIKTLKQNLLNPSKIIKNGDRNEEKLDTASQSLFGYNNGIGGSGGFPGSGTYSPGFGFNGQSTSGFLGNYAGTGGSSGGGGSGIGNFNQIGTNSIDGNRGSGGFSTLGPNGFSGLGQNGFSSFGGSQGGFSGFGQNQGFNQGQYYPGSGIGGGFTNSLYQGQGQGYFGGGGYNPYNGLGGGFNYPQFGFNQGQQGGFYQGGQTDRNLGFVNQAFGNPLYNRSPAPTSNVQPGLGSRQVGNRVDVNSANRGINYIPSGGPGGFATGQSGIYSGGFGQQFAPGSGFGAYNFNGIGGIDGINGMMIPGGGLYNRQNPNIYASQLDYINRGGRGLLRGPTGTASPPRVSGSGDGPGNRQQSTGPNRFYQGTNPAGAFGRERIHRFTSSDETK